MIYEGTGKKGADVEKLFIFAWTFMVVTCQCTVERTEVSCLPNPTSNAIKDTIYVLLAFQKCGYNFSYAAYL